MHVFVYDILFCVFIKCKVICSRADYNANNVLKVNRVGGNCSGKMHRKTGSAAKKSSEMNMYKMTVDITRRF